MALGKAIEFIKQVTYDKPLRQRCNQSKSKESLLEDLGFTAYEFEDAINMQLVKCQTYEQADHVQQIKMWFSLL